MSRPKTTGHRKGGRNRQFFDGLSGLANAIDNAIAKNAPKSAARSEQDDEKSYHSAMDAAEAKRKRKAYARLKNAGLIK